MSAVLDLRRAGARRVEDLWERWDAQAPAWVDALESALEPWRRRALRSRVEGRGAPPADRLVISVGNLRLGGTGKTPVTLDLARGLAAAGRGGAVLCRGYGSGRRGPCLVTPVDASCGDEARLLAASQAWPVIQAADRAAGFRLALASTGPDDVILLEDGHQTARVPRHLDLLLLDRWRVEGGQVRPDAGRPLPWGPYREGAGGAARAAALLVEDAAAPDRDADGRPVLRFTRRSLLDGPVPDGPVGTLAGLARPQGFERACAALLGREPALRARLDDHAAYGPDRRARLRRAAADLGLAAWLTTGKDVMKLGDAGASLGAPLIRVDLELTWHGAAPADLVLDAETSSRKDALR
ncbi:MAG TPA: tetraacyldisaccharide 4'-kinase [Candidatus Krumholzibacteria bacterium]|nr:tetraacyldisaccharide 4'-kinase [Candidatus Krumholzibacteria bacterium]